MTENSISPIILFDGVCNLCCWWVGTIIKQDRVQRFRFASMQSAAGRTLLEELGLPASGPDYVVLVEGGRSFTKSEAVIRIAWRLSAFWRCWARVARLVPRRLRDFKYDFIARHRHRLFGTRASCVVPSPELADRFL